MHASRFLEIEEQQLRIIRKADRTINAARRKVTVPALSKLRPMRSSDVVEGQVVYHSLTADRPMDAWRNRLDWVWHIVQDVRWPDDAFKAYVADDGCRYGLLGAYVDK